MKLCRELKQGETYINYADSGYWDHKLVLDTITVGYEDVTDIEYLHNSKEWLFDNKVFNDCDSFQNLIFEYVALAGWENLTVSQRNIAIEYNAYKDDTNKIIYLMGLGYSQLAAIEYLVDCWSINNSRLINSLAVRFPILKNKLGKRIIKHDLELLTLGNEVLISRLLNYGVLGLNYGSDSEGIMDYIESTNSFTGLGLVESGYTFINQNDTWVDIIAEIKNILVSGYY